MDIIEIQYRLRRVGKTQAQIAKELKLTQGQIGNVIHGRATSERVRNYIATIINCHPDDMLQTTKSSKSKKEQK
jgi:transcriptional regulator with XRE-family HTH domain